MRYTDPQLDQELYEWLASPEPTSHEQSVSGHLASPGALGDAEVDAWLSQALKSAHGAPSEDGLIEWTLCRHDGGR